MRCVSRIAYDVWRMAYCVWRGSAESCGIRNTQYVVRLLLLALVIFALSSPASAQTDELTLSLSRDFGYGGLGGDIEGLFSMKVKGPDDLVSVQFMIDGQVVSEDTEPPFRYQFQTGNFSLGTHTLSATGMTSDGRVLTSNELRREFVSPRAGWQATAKIAVPLLVVTGIVILVAAVGPWLLGRRSGKKKGYGLFGGAICPKCGKPFARHVWALNLGMSKLDRCPHCGKWSVVRAASPDQLAAAEQSELAGAGDEPRVDALTPEEQLKRQLEDSRFEDG